MAFDLIGIANLATSRREVADESVLTSLARRQRLESAASSNVQGYAEQAADVAEETRLRQLSLLADVGETVDIGDRAMALSDSDNPLDKMQLWYLQQSDQRYTREGNLERLSYLNNATSMLGLEGEIRQNNINAQIDRVERGVNMAMQGDEDEATRLEASAAAAKTQLDMAITRRNIENSQAAEDRRLQAQVLDEIPEVELNAALTTASTEGLTTVNLGGLDIPVETALIRSDERARNRIEATLRKSNQVTLALTEMADTDFAALVGAKEPVELGNGMIATPGNILDATTFRNNRSTQALQSAANLRSSIDASMAASAESFSSGILQKGIQEGGVIDGETFPVPLLQNQLQIKLAEVARSTQISTNLAQMGDAESIFMTGNEWALGMAEQPIMDTPAATKIDNLINNMLVAYGQIDSNYDDTENAIAASSIVAIMKESVNAEIKIQAAIMGGSDERLTGMLEYSLAGQPIPMPVINEALDYASNPRNVNRTPVATYLGTESARVFTKAYQEAMTEARNTISIGGRAPAAELHNVALTAGLGALNESYMQASTLPYVITQMQSPTNPLRGLVEPEKFAAILAESDNKGRRSWELEKNITINKNTKLTPEQQSEIATNQTVELLLSLEETQTGLAKAYTDWWASQDSRNYTNGYAAAKFSAGSLDQSIQGSFMLDGIGAMGSSQSLMVQTAYRIFDASALMEQRNNFILFNGEEGLRQRTLLNLDTNLNATDRQIYMDKLLPLLTTAWEEQLAGGVYKNDNATDRAASYEMSLQTMNFQLPELQAVARKVLQGRQGALEQLSVFTQLDTFIQGGE